MGTGLERAIAEVARVCQTGEANLGAFRKQLLSSLRRFLTIDAAFFATADPETLLFTSSWADESLVRSGKAFLDNEFSAAADVNRFSELSRASSPVATLDDATGYDRAASARWREILKPIGFGDELRVALRNGSTTWGFLCLHREQAANGFSAQDSALLKRVSPHIGNALRRIVASSIAEGGAASETAVVLVTDECVVGLTSAAATCLDELGVGRVEPGDAIPAQLQGVVRTLLALERDPAAARLPTVRLATPRGSLFEVHGSRVKQSGATAIFALTLAPAAAAARSSLLSAALGFTPAQRRVAALVVQGFSTEQIALELKVSSYTVQDHLKAVFERAGLASRRELVRALLGGS